MRNLNPLHLPLRFGWKRPFGLLQVLPTGGEFLVFETALSQLETKPRGAVMA